MSNQMEVVKQVHGQIQAIKSGLEAALPSHISVDKFMRVAQTAVLSNHKLLQGMQQNKSSFFAACIRAAQDGLLPDGQEAALIPYGNEITYQAMTKGILKKARNSGEIKALDALNVFSNDTYDAWTDEKGPHFNHRKHYGDRGVYVLTYAYAILKDGGVYFEEVHAEDMEKIRQKAQKNSGPWKDFPGEMRRKSALKRLLKLRVPTSTDLDFTLEKDNDNYDLPSDSPPEEKPVEKPVDNTRPNNLAAAIAEDTPAEESTEGFDPEEELPI